MKLKAWKSALALALKKTPRTASEFAKLPEHVAIIMDGNGRWAKKHHLNVSRGHRQGTENLREIIRHTDDLGIRALSLYAFSTENWNRSEEEVSALMQLMLDFFTSEIDELDAKNVRILILGDKSRMPERQREVLREAEKRTEKNTGLQLNIAINYGSRAEIVKATREIAVMVKNGTIRPEEITEETISDHLYTAGQRDVDLMIRTSGEQRLSNFLLYQNAYAEFVFPEVLWPDFSVHEYDLALEAYGRRDRRFGGR
jgi:undecaprenyl diphosphate synthase